MSTQTTKNEQVTSDDIQSVERGDIITIEGTQYPVYRLNDGLRAILMPNFPSVVTPQGVRDLAFGQLPDSDSDSMALAWSDNCHDNMTVDDCITVGLDNVSIHNGSETDVLRQLPHTDTRHCPNCDNDSAQYHFGERDGSHTQEGRKCTECETHFVIDREIPHETATVQAQSHNGEYGDTVELEGIYREVITSRFKLDPRQRAREGFYSANEVKAKIDAKMNDEGDAEQFGYTTVNERLRTPSVTWRDDWYDQKLEVTYEPVR